MCFLHWSSMWKMSHLIHNHCNRHTLFSCSLLTASDGDAKMNNHAPYSHMRNYLLPDQATIASRSPCWPIITPTSIDVSIPKQKIAEPSLTLVRRWSLNYYLCYSLHSCDDHICFHLCLEKSKLCPFHCFRGSYTYPRRNRLTNNL